MFYPLVYFPMLLTAYHVPQKKQTETNGLISLLVNRIRNIAIFTINPEGVIMSWNRGAKHILGYTTKEVIGKPMSFLFPKLKNSNKLHEDLQTALDLGQYNHETTVLTKDGKKLWVNCIITALWDKEKKLQGFSKLIEDITERKERDKRREDFISLVGHELKNPLTSVKSYLQILQLKMQKQREMQLLPFVEKALMQLDKLSSLMEDLLNTSRIDTGTLRYEDRYPLNLDVFLKEIVDLLQPTIPNHHIIIDGDIHKTIYIDKTRLEQVVSNLLLNAIKYSPDNTDIFLHVSESSDDICIGVEDFGIGISEKNKEKIFHRFQRLPEAKQLTTGLGLGLYLASEIVFHYGGKIWVESKKGKGSTFYFTLPSNLKKKK